MFLMKAYETRKNINLPRSFFISYVTASVRSSLEYFIWLKSKRVEIYLVVKSVKLILVLRIYVFIQACHLMCRGLSLNKVQLSQSYFQLQLIW